MAPIVTLTKVAVFGLLLLTIASCDMASNLATGLVQGRQQGYASQFCSEVRATAQTGCAGARICILRESYPNCF